MKLKTGLAQIGMVPFWMF